MQLAGLDRGICWCLILRDFTPSFPVTDSGLQPADLVVGSLPLSLGMEGCENPVLPLFLPLARGSLAVSPYREGSPPALGGFAGATRLYSLRGGDRGDGDDDSPG